MSNELNNILSLAPTVPTRVSPLGDRYYPGPTFIDLLRYEQDPECKMLLLLGEVGGIKEYRIIETVKNH